MIFSKETSMRALIIALALAGVAAPALADAPELIAEVSSATVRPAGPGAVEVCARGTVPTGGWTGAEIAPAPGAPRHGQVYDLDFTAVRPGGMASQIVSPITACFVWRGAPAGLKGVRVRGERAAALAMLGAP
jgi:hypothetical protein